jgi:hypothetical protein
MEHIEDFIDIGEIAKESRREIDKLYELFRNMFGYNYISIKSNLGERIRDGDNKKNKS